MYLPSLQEDDACIIDYCKQQTGSDASKVVCIWRKEKRVVLLTHMPRLEIWGLILSL